MDPRQRFPRPVPYPGPPHPPYHPGMARFAAFLQRLHLGQVPLPRIPQAWMGPRFPTPGRGPARSG